MSIWKIVSGILSIVLCFFVIFQSCAAGIVNALTQNGDISGSAGLLVAVLLLVGGIVSIATRDAIGNGGNISIIILYGVGTVIGYIMAGIYTDLLIWSTWCLLCAVMASMAIASDNVCGPLVYIIISLVGIVIAVVGFGMNLGKDMEAPNSAGKKDTPIAAAASKDDDMEEFDVAPTEKNGNSEAARSGGTEDSGTLGDYYVKIKDATFDEDYEGTPVIVITYAWTNNSEETINAEVALSEKAFQDGVQIDSAVISSGNSNYDPEASWRDIRPGTTLEVCCAFKYRNKTSPIEVEVSEFLSLSDAVVSKTFDPRDLE